MELRNLRNLAQLTDKAVASGDEAALRSARAYLFAVTEDAFGRLSAGGDLDVTARALLRLAATHAATVGAEVTRTVYRMSGTIGMFTDSRIARCSRDAMVVPQHVLLAEGTWEQAGQVLLCGSGIRVRSHSIHRQSRVC